ncbi:MAG: hypothetical protein WCK35_08765 [Chloroflexota bacterium]
MPTNFSIFTTLLAFLFVCTIFDLRDRNVPMYLTISGLAASGMLALLHGFWASVLLTIAIILASDIANSSRRLILVSAIFSMSAFLHPGEIPLCAGITLAWTLWEFDAMGGADVKLLIASLLTLGSPQVLIPIAVAGGIQGVIAALRKKKEIPFVLSIFFGTLLFLAAPNI